MQLLTCVFLALSASYIIRKTAHFRVSIRENGDVYTLCKLATRHCQKTQKTNKTNKQINTPTNKHINKILSIRVIDSSSPFEAGIHLFMCIKELLSRCSSLYLQSILLRKVLKYIRNVKYIVSAWKMGANELMSTNKFIFAPVVLEIPCNIFINKTSSFH